LFSQIEIIKPDAVFLGGDLLPSGLFSLTAKESVPANFTVDVIQKGFLELKQKLKNEYPRVFIILGNDDGAQDEQFFIDAETLGIWEYVHFRKTNFDRFTVFGYSFIPPTPFMLKDWEKYDVSRFTDPGCVSPEEGFHSKPFQKHEVFYSTIEKDLKSLAGEDNLFDSIFLFHSPPYQTNLDRAALDGKYFEHVPLDVNVGSIAIRRFIEKKQPLITLHGHVHESAHLTGNWKDKIGNTFCFSAAHDGTELSMILFDIENPQAAERRLI
jgi:Icc-related predicted phosphoesterase